VTSLAYDEPFNIYLKTNATFSCLNLTVSNSSLKSDGWILNTSYHLAGNSSSGSLWNYIDLSGCTSRFLIPYFMFSTVCKDCYQDNSQLDYYYLIVE
jgi:hypothetical protein